MYVEKGLPRNNTRCTLAGVETFTFMCIGDLMDDQTSYGLDTDESHPQQINPVFGFSKIPRQVAKHYVNLGQIEDVESITFCEVDEQTQYRPRARLEIVRKGSPAMEDVWEWSLLPEEEWFPSFHDPDKTNKMAWRLTEKNEIED